MDAIANEFLDCVRRTVARVMEEDGHQSFHRALLSDDVLPLEPFREVF